MQRHTHTRYVGSRALAGLFMVLAACADQPTAPVAELNELRAPQFDLGPGQIIVVMEDLGSDLGATISTANAINNAQQITGSRTVQGGTRAYVWAPPGNVTDLGTLGQAPYTFSGLDINDAGVVVGQAGTHAFRWTPPGPMVQLGSGSGSGSVFEAAYAVNSGATAAGILAGTLDFPVYWEAGGQSPTYMIHPGPSEAEGSPLVGGRVNDINDQSYMVGVWNDTRAFLWHQNGLFTELAELSGSTSSTAMAINESGVIAGSSTTAAKQRAVRWPSHQSPAQDLGTLGGSWSAATDINEDGIIVGVSSTSSGAARAFRLDPNGLPQNLGAPKGALSSGARGISDQGHIVGTATFPNRVIHAVVWWNFTSKNVTAVSADVSTVLSGSSTSPFEVTLLSTDVLDALAIDPGTLTLGDNVNDDLLVLRGADGEPETDERDVNRDGRTDLIVSFDARQLVAEEVPAGSDRATLMLKGAALDRRTGVYATVEVTVER